MADLKILDLPEGAPAQGTDTFPIARSAGETKKLALSAITAFFTGSFASLTHATRHQNGGADEINVAGLSGLLADPQTPTAHATSHADGGADELNVTGLTGVLGTPQTPAAHKVTHQVGGTDEIAVTGLTGLLATPQTPVAHKTSHQNGGADEIDVTGLSGVLADPQTPVVHAASHADGGGDELSVAGLSGQLADAQKITVRKNNGADVGTRSRLNFVEGPNVTLTVADDSGSGEIDVTIESTAAGGGGGTVTTTGTPALGNLTKFSGATAITNGDLSGDVTTAGTLAATIANDAVTYPKMQNVSAASKLLGRGDSGSGDPQEITLGANLTMTGTTLDAAGGAGGGTVTTTGSPASTQVAVMSGATSITSTSGLTYASASGAFTSTTPVDGGAAPLGAEARASATTGVLTGALLVATSTGQMADGFGVGQLYFVKDADAVYNSIAQTYATRAGADATGAFAITTAIAGTHADRFAIDATGAVRIPNLGGGGTRVVQTDNAGLLSGVSLPGTLYDNAAATAATTPGTGEQTIYSFNLVGGDLTATRKLRVTLRGTILANSGTPTFTFRVKLGATTLWGDISVGLGAMATRAAFMLDFILANLNATNSQAMLGMFSLSNRAAAASIAGIGDIGATGLGTGMIGGVATEDTTGTLAVAVTVVMSVNNAAVEVLRQIAFAELIG